MSLQSVVTGVLCVYRFLTSGKIGIELISEANSGFTSKAHCQGATLASQASTHDASVVSSNSITSWGVSE